MRTDLNTVEPIDLYDTFVTDSDLIGFDRPRDIVRDPVLTLSRKRQLLAYWASDVHAVTGQPGPRACAFGPTVSIDDIKAALCELDDMVDLPAARAAQGRGAAA